MCYQTDSNINRVPNNAIELGRQHDCGTVYLAVVDSQYGQIPGKATAGYAWYGYNGVETRTNKFVWVTVPQGYEAYTVNSSAPPNGALKTGFQTDYGDMYAGIAHTQYGNIPCKIHGNDGACHYVYGGKEIRTSSFSYVALRKV